MMENPFLVIKLKAPNPDGAGVGIRWVDPHPEIDIPMDAKDTDVWDEGDQAWTKICNSIHALIGELDPIPEGGWEIEFSCLDTSLIIEKGLTRNQYHDRNKPKCSILKKALLTPLRFLKTIFSKKVPMDSP